MVIGWDKALDVTALILTQLDTTVFQQMQTVPLNHACARGMCRDDLAQMMDAL
ncbi:hypothetical protein HMPREF1992_02312 [Selenomonas sp. oral taxon 892 str. F0426]|nr:hypothetical protein HMPREF1992_02312 [Selenomonas sp. oral taxon 892 str. F0426]